MKKYNLERIQAFVGEDEEMIKKVVKMFLKNSPQKLKNIKESHKLNDLKKLAFNAHKLKNSIDHFSIEALTTTIREIENYSKSGTHIDLLPSLIQMLEKELKEAINEIKADF